MKESGRHKFLASCLEKLSASDNVKQAAQQKKRASCEQNAKNFSLQGAKKDGYVGTCMKKNEVAIAMEDARTGDSAAVQKTAGGKASRKPSAKSQRANSCSDQAGAQDLKGAARKDFIAKCKGRQKRGEGKK